MSEPHFKALADRTAAEMRAGAKLVGTAPNEAEQRIEGMRVWKLADEWEKYWNNLMGRGGHVNVIAARLEPESSLWLFTKVHRDGQEPVQFPGEPPDAYPSSLLRTQLMLVIG